jgi:branched-chain amino acid transport system ATP-binding protein
MSSRQEAEPVFRMDGLRAGYGGREVLRGLELNVRSGEIVLVIGHNGAGKSTIAKAVLGLTDFASGSATLDGRELVGRSVTDRVRAGIGYVPQSRGVFPSFSVRHNLELGGHTLADRAMVSRRIERAYRQFPALADKDRVSASLLSGGQQRMLSIAMATMIEPRVVFVDEPSAGLAPRLVDEVMTHLDQLRHTSNTGVVLIEQNVAAALRVADRVYVLRAGRRIGEFGASELAGRESYWDLL